MLRACAIALGVFFAACECGPRCDVATCGGCCDSTASCLPGNNTKVCGRMGQACFACQGFGEVCFEGRCVVPGPGGPGGTGGGFAGGASGGNALIGGGFATAGGPAAGGTVTYPPLLEVVGQPCSALADTPGGECSQELMCLPVPATTRFACQFKCEGTACAANTGVCQSVTEAGRSCLDCLTPCQVGGPGCGSNELCVQRGPGGVCTPDCRLVGARCPSPQQCVMSTGRCSGGGLVSYCLRF